MPPEKKKTRSSKRKRDKTFIKVEKVSKSYKMGEVEVKALDEVSISIKKGGIISIVGPSGSGKTTLLNVIGALDYVDKGNISIDGQKLSTLSEKELSYLRREIIGYVFQNFNLLEEINAEKNIEMPMILAKRPKEERKQKTEELLKAVGLYDRKNHKPDQLSGGEQQRTAIARALANDPELILADELTGNLDSDTGDKIINLLLELSKEKKKTLVFVTHDNELAILADRQLYMSDGQIVKDFSAK